MMGSGYLAEFVGTALLILFGNERYCRCLASYWKFCTEVTSPLGAS